MNILDFYDKVKTNLKENRYGWAVFLDYQKTLENILQKFVQKRKKGFSGRHKRETPSMDRLPKRNETKNTCQ